MNTRLRFSGLALAAAVGGLLVLALGVRPSVAHDGDEGHGFSNRTVRGAWGFNTSFANVLPGGGAAALPGAGMGRVVFDGEGRCSVHSFANVNGQTQEIESSSCTYNVGPDGIGSSEAVFPGGPFPGPVPVAFVIVDHAQELRFLNTKYIVGTFTARRQ